MSVIEEIRTKTDIIDIISAYVSINQSGKYFKSICPFHSEKTPSFIVNPDRQSWHCFGACGTGGDVFSFVMRMESIGFGESIKFLANKTGVELKEKKNDSKFQELYQANIVALEFFQENLNSSNADYANKYLLKRGIDNETAEKFKIGLSLGDLTSHLKSKGLNENICESAGLIKKFDSGYRDFFKNRLMFPIHDWKGNVIGFGARSLDDSMPKYINTSATSIFDKKSILYGLNLAYSQIKKSKKAIIVEGYMDVIAAHQNGYNNVVASMGTAITKQQVAALKLIGNEFVLALDADFAGQEATLRSLDSAWELIGNSQSSRNQSFTNNKSTSFSLKIAEVPQGQDPDELIRKDSEKWEFIINNAEPLIDYLIRILALKIDIQSGEGKMQLVKNIFPLITSIDNYFDQDKYIRLLSKKLDVSESSVRASFSSLKNNKVIYRKKDDSPLISNLNPKTEGQLEKYVLCLLLDNPEFKEYVFEFSPENFSNSEYKEIFIRWRDSSNINQLSNDLDGYLLNLLTEMLSNESVSLDMKQKKDALFECLNRLERDHLIELQKEILSTKHEKIPPSRDLEEKIVELNKLIKKSFLKK
ncbi:MAG: DNA primase [Dehalococcoidia bacterium]